MMHPICETCGWQGEPTLDLHAAHVAVHSHAAEEHFALIAAETVEHPGMWIEDHEPTDLHEGQENR